MRYKIKVLTLQGDLLTYHVSNYKIEDGFVKFTDEKTKKEKMFACSRTEIEPGEDK
jgi:hypothetical protein